MGTIARVEPHVIQRLATVGHQVVIVAGDRLTVAGVTDEFRVSVTYPQPGVAESFAIDDRDARIAVTGSREPVTIELRHPEVVIGGDLVESRVPVEAPAKVPTIEDPESTAEIDLDLARTVAATAASRDNYRPLLCGVMVENGWCVATDSYRLHAQPHADVPATFLPLKLMSALRNLGAVGKVTAATSRRWCTVTAVVGEGVEVTVAAEVPHNVDSGGEWKRGYPNWQQLIPSNLGLIGVDLDDDQAAQIRRALAVFAADKHAANVALLNEGGASVLRQQSDGRTATAVSPVVWPAEMSGYLLNARYFADVLRLGAGRLAVQTGDEHRVKPVLYEGEDCSRQLLMPVRASR